MDGKERMGDENIEFTLVIGDGKSLAGRPSGTIRPPACTFEKLYIAAVLQGTHTHT